MTQKADWQPIETAPEHRPVWTSFRHGGKTYERIATGTGGEKRDPRNWRFDSNQVNFFVERNISKAAPYHREQRINMTAWRELAHAEEEDPNNLGKPKRTHKESSGHTPAQSQLAL